MAIPKKIFNFLEKGKVKYEPIKHRTVYTAYDKAATLRVPQKIVGKTLVVKLDKDYGLVLIPSNKNLDQMKLKKLVNTERKKAGKNPIKKIDFATELWIKKNLKSVKLGAVPPFGSLWPLARRGQRPGGRLPAFMDRGLLGNQKIIVNAGDYNWSIKIKPADFKKLAPDSVIGSFTEAKKQKKKRKAKKTE